ncbi:aminotransferase class I/II-fold pyridoxal phosphate-dependent enzyme [Streptomyces sudanensis]|uniref:aminotransferase class I/II-fold pyridoxal phosphate-dependent enzyme n=1 Tax=Streptomyces sudanensis TaxID=436397 RepID=UPI0020CF0F74|nr:aminotransferase class I/II-fold pyridoxal phosphate-dependent enzyme [Streptomyces sudanensis]MCP9957224.1 aminotransferase class I/II-fold pyridoxal phosphate-dependent enzyme [Streptomyces sudanensis]MCQ0002212.1 aminotransferase class I/II-fold pyridoxal phosphate-dependent enzyme [Streptomyces sudanensis]
MPTDGSMSTGTPHGAADGPPAEDPRFVADAGALRARRTLKWQEGAPDPERICLGIAEMDLETPEFLHAVLARAVRDGETGYGLTGEQERACARYLAEEHHASTAGLRCTTDILAGLRTLLRDRLPPGSGVIVETPVYGDLPTVVEEAGMRPVAVPLLRDASGYRRDHAALDAAAAAGAAAWILSQPHNPVGRAWNDTEIAEALDLVRRHDLLLLANEVHMPLGLGGRTRSVFSDPAVHRARVLGLTSASKAFNVPGLKSATIYASDRTAAALAALPQGLLGRPGSLGAIATVACYEQGTAWLAALRAVLAERVELVRAELSRLPLRVDAAVPEATYLLWAEVPEPEEAKRFADALATARVHVSPGPAFGGDAYTGFFRFNAAAHPAVLGEAFDRVRAAL